MTPQQTLALVHLAHAFRSASPMAWLRVRLLLGLGELEALGARAWADNIVEVIFGRKAPGTVLVVVHHDLVCRLGTAPPLIRARLAHVLRFPTTSALEESIRAALAWGGLQPPMAEAHHVH